VRVFAETTFSLIKILNKASISFSLWAVSGTDGFKVCWEARISNIEDFIPVNLNSFSKKFVKNGF